jgi:hypothetical protein
MLLKIQIDKPINEQLLFEELTAIRAVSHLSIDSETGYIEVSSDDPLSVIGVYQAHDHTQVSQEEQLVTERQGKAATLRQQAENLDWGSMTTQQAIHILQHVVNYLLARLDSEHE